MVTSAPSQTQKADSSEPTYSEESHPGRRKGDKGQYCPKCHNNIEAGHMDSHMYYAHGEDRRAAPETQTPPAPERRERRAPAKATPKSDDGGEQQKPKKSVWFRRPE